ncbi:equilibrative nucleoside transporter 3-like protein [Trifolium pratense]|uniref:Equilibrative nucleoside transporter 3-like protein n=1 Tax=Trifolium pratense TaxID=57577 RepID=A0A2K3MTF5_TRIPR|nr:equilibrative nucleoside transporter 3-like protein [Trifolium pratense]
MEDKETVSDFFTRVAKIVNEMKACGETVTSSMRVEKILRSLSPRFDYVVAAIEEYKDLDSMKVEELQGSLEAHEQRMNQRNSDKSKGEIALQAQQSNKDKKGKGKWQGYKGRGLPEYKWSKDESSDAEAKMARNDDGEGLVMLLVTTRDDSDCQEKWNLDIRCSTHMTGIKDWFTSLKATQNNNVKFADNRSLAVQGIRDVSIKRKDGECSVIFGVLYIPSMTCNLLSIGQLLEKDYKIVMENKLLKVYNTKGSLVLKTPMSKNRTFKIGLDILNHKCLMTASSREKWRWNYRIGHLNFKDLNLLQNQNLVTGLPKLQVLEEMYVDQCKLTQWSFKKFKATVERQSGQKLKTLRTDGGGEYMSHEFAKFCDSEGIVHDIVPPYIPQQNGTAERKNRIIMNMVRCMLKGKHLPKELWGEAISTATYTLNRCPTKRLKGITPEECWSVAYKHTPDQLRKKLDDKSTMMILVGYHSTGGYKLYDPVNKNVVISRDVVIDELKEWDRNTNEKKNSVSVMIEEINEEQENQPVIDLIRSTRTRVLPARLQECELNSDNQVNN